VQLPEDLELAALDILDIDDAGEQAARGLWVKD